MINLIDQNSNFNQSLSQFPNSLATVAIFGSQSSGKSTLMNDAFQTHFPVLDTLQDRKRCTKGVWFQNKSKFTIIDTEGFDSAQRAQEQRIFERQVALFSLVVSDVIIVNLWMNEIGRYKGSQVHILKAIVNASSRLIKSQQKTIIFVVKDCSVDANKNILKEALDNSFNSILRGVPKGVDPIRFNVQYLFLNHYVYRHEEYLKGVKELINMIKVRKSTLKEYSPKDRMIYLNHMWKTIKENGKEIDLRVEEEALRLFIVERVRNEVIERVQEQIESVNKLGNLNSYQRFYEFYIKKSFSEIKKQMPLYVNYETTQTQYFLLEEELSYVIQKHFTDFILPSEQNHIIANTLIKELRKSFESVKLQSVIENQRKKAIQEYKGVVKGHRQAHFLLALFQQKINKESVGYERQVSHLFNMFESKLQKEVNRQIDKQIRKRQFNQQAIQEKVKKQCTRFDYNETAVHVDEIWEKVAHRVLNHEIPEQIQRLSERLTFSVFQEEKQTQIILAYKKMEKSLSEFCEKMLTYFDQEEKIGLYKQKVRQKTRECLQESLKKEKVRFHLNFILIAIFLFFAYKEIIFLMKFLPIRKRTRRYGRYFLKVLTFILFVGGLLKIIGKRNTKKNSSSQSI